MYNHDYSSDYNPAMPALEVGLGLVRSQIILTLPAIVDSGADATLIPVSYVDQIGALPAGEQWLRGVVGEGYTVEIYPIFIQIGNYSLYVKAVGDELNDELIIGRDVLNQFIVTLNGLASMVEISQ